MPRSRFFGLFVRLPSVRKSAKSAQQAAPNVQQGALPHGEVPPGVLGQVVTAHETAVAHGTGEPLLPRVGSVVARQLIGSSELPLTVFPLALEGLLTCGRTNVC